MPENASDAQALALLDQIAQDLLRLSPETATALGIDTDARAPLRAQLADRSADGVQRLALQLRAGLERVNALPPVDLSHPVRTSVAVVRSAYTTALEGFALPYGDVAVGGWRNTPYVVIQNVGAYLDVPRFLDADHPIENAADAEAYLARLESYARQLDGELGRLKAAREMGLVPPRFLLEKALSQINLSAQNARAGGSLVDSISRRTKNIPGDWAGAGPGASRHSRLAPRSIARSRSSRPSVPSRRTPLASRLDLMERTSIAGRSRHRPPRRSRPTKCTSWAGASSSLCTAGWMRY